MNPEVKHIVSELRREFYSNFAAAMNMPVIITGTSYSSNSPIASWMDYRERLNYEPIPLIKSFESIYG